MDQKKDVKSAEQKSNTITKKGVTKVVGSIVLSSRFSINLCKCENKYLTEPRKKNEIIWRKEKK